MLGQVSIWSNNKLIQIIEILGAICINRSDEIKKDAEASFFMHLRSVK